MGILSKISQIGLIPSAAIAKVLAPTKYKGISLKEMTVQGAETTIGKIIGTSVAVVGTAVTLGKGKAIIKAVKPLLPTTVKGKVTAAIVAPIVAGAVISQPAAVATLIAKAPSELGKFGAGVATLVSEPSLEHVKELITESPLLTAGAVALGVVGVVKAVGVGGAVLAGKVMGDDQDQVIVKVEGNGKAKAEKSLETISEMPKTPTTTTVTKGVTKYRKKAKIEPTRITQRVNILMQNRNTSYLNKRAYS